MFTLIERYSLEFSRAYHLLLIFTFVLMSQCGANLLTIEGIAAILFSFFAPHWVWRLVRELDEVTPDKHDN